MHTEVSVQGIPLCSTSMHAVNVHGSWPAERIKHYRKICTDSNDSDLARCRMICKLIKYVPEHVWLASRTTYPIRESKAVGGSWIVLPFHRCFDVPTIRHTIREIESLFLAVGLSDYSPRFSWRNGDRNLQTRVQSFYHGFIKPHHHVGI